ncbi:uncharacterized protein H6S33_003892 [Morchella sextelata]|uniref:uncharacterized protein n=1 Tax=Morchella sextelata TaxID=1174677 RepID=UPI001D054B85|nr:uncharacterized protein H6S33_003892 [Morchella sextelata]KAH0606231.1 hypothetical protein H6S33_003892 [Morchella sextelata]
MAFDIPGREVVVVRADVLAMAESSEVNVCDTTSKQMGENVLGKRTLIYLYGRDPLLTELDGNIFYLVVIEVLAKNDGIRRGRQYVVHSGKHEEVTLTHNESNVGFPRFYSFLAVMMIEEAYQTPSSSRGFCTIHVLHHASSLMQSVGVNVFSLLK